MDNINYLVNGGLYLYSATYGALIIAFIFLTIFLGIKLLRTLEKLLESGRTRHFEQFLKKVFFFDALTIVGDNFCIYSGWLSHSYYYCSRGISICCN
jgi:hypothetical protein